jgi:hypothetical protein
MYPLTEANGVELRMVALAHVVDEGRHGAGMALVGSIWTALRILRRYGGILKMPSVRRGVPGRR